MSGYKSIRRIGIDKRKDDLLVKSAGFVGSGGNSGFQALNLAVQFGAERILLVGFDMHDRKGAHWYGRNKWHGANNPNDSNFRRWMDAFKSAVPVLNEMKIEVINASPDSAMECFPRQSIEDALTSWQ